MKERVENILNNAFIQDIAERQGIMLELIKDLWTENRTMTFGFEETLLAHTQSLEENQRVAIEALEFYANPSDYKTPYTAGLGKLYFDCGTIAEQALSTIRGK